MPDAKQKWPGLSADKTLIINIDKGEFNIQPSPLDFAGKLFKPKQETHITVFGSSVGAAILQHISKHPEVEEKLIEAFEGTDWSYNTTTNYHHLVRAGTAQAAADTTVESIILLLVMDGMTVFYEKLKSLRLIEKDHPVPPPHVTLYTFNCDTGIGVDSQSELKELSREQLENPV